MPEYQRNREGRRIRTDLVRDGGPYRTERQGGNLRGKEKGITLGSAVSLGTTTDTPFWSPKPESAARSPKAAFRGERGLIPRQLGPEEPQFRGTFKKAGNGQALNPTLGEGGIL